MATATDTPERIVLAAVDCLVRVGWERTTISAVAARAGVSRPTVYAHFPTRDDLYVAAAERASIELTRRVADRLPPVASGAEFVVELVSAWLAEYRSDPSASIVGLVRPERALSAESIAIARSFLGPLVALEPHLEPELDEVAETAVRFLLSFLLFESESTATDAALRGYLRRRLVPALGLARDG